MASFRLAVNRRFAKEGEQQADFFNVVAWQKLAEICGNNLTKGRQVLVDGYLQIRTYDAQDGTKRYVTEIIANEVEFMGSKPNNTDSTNNHADIGDELPPDEDIPF